MPERHGQDGRPARVPWQFHTAKTAAMPPSSEHLAILWRPYIEPCIEVFGADRCMASSNFPVDGAGMTYGTLWNTFKRINRCLLR